MRLEIIFLFAFVASCFNMEVSSITVSVGNLTAEQLAAIFAELNVTATDIDECAKILPVCHANAICLNNFGSYNCTCETGFNEIAEDEQGATHCEDINECDTSGAEDPCAGITDSTCVNIDGGFTCDCANGYEKNTNETSCVDIDECVESKCDSSGPSNCENSEGSFTCTCKDGYEKDDDQVCQDVDECTSGTHNCLTNQDCTDVVGTFTCLCKNGYKESSDADGDCVDRDECVDDGTDPCVGITESTCSNNVGSYACTCLSGNEINTVSNACEDIDECDTTNLRHDCDVNEKCVNAIGSFTCECADGFIGDADANTCTDDDECADKPCDEHATCINQVGTHECYCLTGFFGSGNKGDCNDVLSCATYDKVKEAIVMVRDAVEGSDVSAFVTILEQYAIASGKPDGVAGDTYRAAFLGDVDTDIGNVIEQLRCDYFSSCSESVNATTGYTCTCNTGYQLYTDSTTQCTDIDECTSTSPCGLAATCSNNEGSYTCECKAGYRLSGDINSDCVDINECTDTDVTHNCHLDAICTNEVPLFSCTCKAGFYGIGLTCESSTTCVAYDIMKASINAIRTSTGTDEEIEAANTLLKQYIATVDITSTIPAETYTQLFTNFSDTIIEQAVPLLICDYVSTCSMESDGHSCSCNDGYAAVSSNPNQCEDIDECETGGVNNCHDDATCTDKPGSFECECKDGFDGDGEMCTDINECETDKHDCDSENGVCNNNDGSFTCSCMSGFMFSGVGNQCESATNCEAYVKVKAAVEELRTNTGDAEANTMILQRYIDAEGKADGVSSDSYKLAYPEDGGNVVLQAVGALRCDYFSSCSVNESDTSYQCSCMEGYTAFAEAVNQCLDFNECSVDNFNNCNADATCANNQGSFGCTCKEGYEGNGVDCTDVDECADGTHDCDATVSHCNNIIGSHACICIEDGFQWNDTTCVDLNECLDDTDNCDSAVSTCENTPGAFVCNCNEIGYEWDGTTCIDVNECDEDTLNTCDTTAGVCTNEVATYTCSCKSGYMGTGQTDKCTDVLACSTFVTVKTAIDVVQTASEDDDISAEIKILEQYNNATGKADGASGDAYRAVFGVDLNVDIANVIDELQCDYFSSCTDSTDDSMEDTCSCNTGYEFYVNSNTSSASTIQCTDIDECAAEDDNNCHVFADCSNTFGSFTCVCKDGFFGDGTTCSDHDECIGEDGGHDCDDNADCDNIDGGHTCTCISGYYGDGKIGNCKDMATCGTFDLVKESIRNVQDVTNSTAVDAARKVLTEYANAEGHPHNDTSASYILEYGSDVDADILSVVDKLLCDYHSTCGGDTITCTCEASYIMLSDSDYKCFSVKSCAAFDALKSSIARVREATNDSLATASRDMIKAYVSSGGHADPAASSSAYTAKYGEVEDEDVKNALDLIRCDYFSTCSHADDTYTCTCDTGYTADTVNSCTDLNECETTDNTCDNNALCTNEEGSYGCACNSGYIGDGFDCTDDQQCDTGESTLCGSNAVCTDTVGSYSCSCSIGYNGDGTVCQEISSCVFNDDAVQDGQDCSDYGHPLSCSFEKDFPDLAETHLNAYRAFFKGPSELVSQAAASRGSANFVLSGINTNTICEESTLYDSPRTAFTDLDKTNEIELFSNSCYRQWFVQTECTSTPANINLDCNTVYLPHLALVIQQNSDTGKYEVMPMEVYLPSSCKLEIAT